jgi:N-terminal domain of anti-restriction factor ArdC
MKEYRVMRSNAQRPRQSIYETITAKILDAIEANPGDPIMPWQRGGTRPVLQTNAVTGNAYRGVNILSLWVTALERGYSSGEGATLRQWNEKGACVRKGEKASPIVFYKEITIEGDGDANDEEGETERRRLARGYWVFAAEQVQGYEPATALPPNPIDRIATAEAYFAATGATIIVGGRRPVAELPPIPSTCRTGRASSTVMAAGEPRLGIACSVIRSRTGQHRRTASIASWASASAMISMPWKSAWPRPVQPLSVHAWGSPPNRTRTMRATSTTG